MVAENKRRVESNQIMSEFIEEYLKTLHQSITDKIDGQFIQLRDRVQSIDEQMTNLENEIEYQINDVHQSIEKRQLQSEKDMIQGNNLLVNIKQAKLLQDKEINERQDHLIKQV